MRFLSECHFWYGSNVQEERGKKAARGRRGENSTTATVVGRCSESGSEIFPGH